MLPQKSLRPNYLAFWFCSKIHSMPFTFDRINGQINTTRRRYGWSCWLILAALHCTFITVRLIQAVLFHGAEFFVEQLPFHVICVTAAIFNVYAGIAAFVKWPKLNTLLFNGLYNVAEAKPISSHKEAIIDGSKYEPSKQEILIPMLPQMNFNCCLVLMTIYLTKPHSMQFIYSVLPHYMQTSLALSICVIFEVSVCFYWMGMAHYSNFVHLSFFEKTMETIEDRITKWRTNGNDMDSGSVEKVYLDLRRLQLEISFFNYSNATVVFLWKALNFIVPSFAIYFAITWIEVHPIMAGSNLFIGIYAVLMFIITYDHAFSIPLGIENLKTHVRVALSSSGSKAFQNFYTRRLNSVPNLGIKVGAFHTLERTTTPMFILFITNTVFSLLVLTR